MFPTRRILLILLSISFLSLFAVGQAPHPKFFNERFVIKTMQNIHSAQATYHATTGAGNYGSLAQLHKAGLIDAALASGQKFGYLFVVQTAPSSPTDGFIATATPTVYRKGGLRSFFIDQTGDLRGGDKNGGIATAADPYIDSCALWGIADNERCTIMDMRALHVAQMTYASTVGNGSYGNFGQLYEAGLIRSDLADYISRGYLYTYYQNFPIPPNIPAIFKIWSKPHYYGTTGIRSFYIDQTGVLRGGDKNGQPANENDPPINE